MMYFAYGANTNDQGMEFRCPDALKVGSLTLPDYRLVFRGVADIEHAPHNKVLGVMWDITEQCEKNLDRFEGFPHLYSKGYFVAKVDGVVHDVMYYTMNRCNYGLPSESYFRTIESGYKQNGLPTDLLYESLNALV